MLFTDGNFYLFLVLILALISLFPSREKKRLVLLAASLLFYLQFPLPFFGLLLLTIVVDFFLGIYLGTHRSRGALLLSLSVNFLPLLTFKYLAFSRGSSVPGELLWEDLIVPLGISFYTFKSASYIVDVYRGVTVPCRSLLEYAFFVAYFPALLSGPVSRFGEFERSSETLGMNSANAQKGVTLILYGLVKKIAVADLIHEFSKPFWAMKASGELSAYWAMALILSTYVKLYADFSGYTDIARGVSYLFGIRLPKNFDFPFFARDPTDFWNRQHMSMSRWFGDYVYLPLVKKLRSFPRASVIGALWVTFVLSGLWHGVSFGALLFALTWGFASSGYFLLRRTRHLEIFPRFLAWPLTQLIAMFSVFFLLAPGKEEILWVLRGLLNFHSGDVSWVNPGILAVSLVFLLIHFFHHFLLRRGETPFLTWSRPVALALFLALTIVLNTRTVNFIYYQF